MAEVLEIEQQTPLQEEPPKRKLYNVIVKNKMYSKSYEEFEKQYSTPESIDKIYNAVYSKKLYSKSKGEFQKQYFQQEPAPSKKKAPAVTSTTGGEKPSPTHSSSKPQSLFGKFPTKDEYVAANPSYKPDDVLQPPKQTIVKDETRLPKPIVGETLGAELANRERYQQTKENKKAQVEADIKSMLPKTLGGTMEKERTIANGRGAYVYNKLLDGLESIGAGSMDLIIKGVLADARMKGVTYIGDKPIEQIVSEWDEFKEESRGTVSKMAGADIPDDKKRNTKKNFLHK